jgi:chorismate mutase
MVHGMFDDPHAASARLDPLRSELGQIDREILALVARRQAIAQRIGQVKRDAGIPTRDFRQEKDVVERARAAAVAHGLSAKLGEELILALIRGSLEVQEKDTVVATGEGSGRRALVIGGAGHMGRWFVRYLGALGFSVEIADPNDGPAGIPFTSVHPMFGPDTELLSGRHVIFVDVGSPEARRGARAVRAHHGNARRDGSREPRPPDRLRARAIPCPQHRVLHRARRERRGRPPARHAIVDDVRRPRAT